MSFFQKVKFEFEFSPEVPFIFLTVPDCTIASGRGRTAVYFKKSDFQYGTSFKLYMLTESSKHLRE